MKYARVQERVSTRRFVNNVVHLVVVMLISGCFETFLLVRHRKHCTRVQKSFVKVEMRY